MKKLSGVTADHVPGKKRSLGGRTNSVVTIRSGSETALKGLRVFGFGWKENRERKREKIAYERELSLSFLQAAVVVGRKKNVSNKKQLQKHKKGN